MGGETHERFERLAQSDVRPGLALLLNEGLEKIPVPVQLQQVVLPGQLQTLAEPAPDAHVANINRLTGNRIRYANILRFNTRTAMEDRHAKRAEQTAATLRERGGEGHLYLHTKDDSSWHEVRRGPPEPKGIRACALTADPVESGSAKLIIADPPYGEYSGNGSDILRTLTEVLTAIGFVGQRRPVHVVLFARPAAIRALVEARGRLRPTRPDWASAAGLFFVVFAIEAVLAYNAAARRPQ